jgi:hypothetical protein
MEKKPDVGAKLREVMRNVPQVSKAMAMAMAMAVASFSCCVSALAA